MSWPQDMVDSYKSIHGDLPSGVESEFLSRLQPGEYLYTIFGPTGQNKTICNFVILFNFTGNLSSPKDNHKSGDVLRWDADGTTYSQNNLPDHTKDGAGILTVSSTDGWGGVTQLYFYSNPFNKTMLMPNWGGIGLDNLTHLYIRYTDFLGTLERFSGLSSMQVLDFNTCPYISGNLSSLAGLTALKTIVGPCCPIEGDFGFLVNMPNLLWVELQYYARFPTVVYGDLEVFADKTDLVCLKLRHCYISGNTSSLSLLTKLNYMWLTSFAAINGDLSSISNLVNLKNFIISGPGTLTGNLTDLLGMTQLTGFNIGGSEVEGDIGVLSELTDLQAFEAEHTPIMGDIGVFGELPNFKILKTTGTAVTGDIAGLAPMVDAWEIQIDECPGLTVSSWTGGKDNYWFFGNDNDWSESEVDAVIHGYKLLADAGELHKFLRLRLQNNSVPSAAGFADLSVLQNYFDSHGIQLYLTIDEPPVGDDPSFVVSLRKFIDTYSGPSMRVLAWTGTESDGEADVLFVDDIITMYSPVNNLDEIALARSPVPTTLMELVGANTGLIKTRYDQSGNIYYVCNVSQTNPAKMPIVVSGGILIESLLDGVNDFLEAINVTNLELRSKSISWGGWVRVSTGVDYRGVFVGKGYGPYKRVYLIHRDESGSKWKAFIRDHDTDTINLSSNWIYDSWQFVMATYDAEIHELVLYIDSTSNSKIDTDVGGDMTSPRRFTLGAISKGSDNFYKGYMGDVFVYLRRVLSAAEVAALRSLTDNQIENYLSVIVPETVHITFYISKIYDTSLDVCRQNLLNLFIIQVYANLTQVAEIAHFILKICRLYTRTMRV